MQQEQQISTNSDNLPFKALFLKFGFDERTQEIISQLNQVNYQVTLCPTTQEAIETYKRLGPNHFTLIIAALGVQQDKSDFYADLVSTVRNQDQSIFIAIFSSTACKKAKRRLQLFNDDKVNMVTECINSLKYVASNISKTISRKGKYQCPICKVDKFKEDELWIHLPLYHVNSEVRLGFCPICKKDCRNIAVHYRNKHGPCGRGEMPNEDAECNDLSAFSLVVVRRKSDGKYLLVQEFANSGFWLPGGRVDPGESLRKAAIRECQEEAGIDINVTGILTIQHTPQQGHDRLRMIYFAEPVDENQLPKSIPDYESVGACYVDIQDLQNIKLRGNEPVQWLPYVENGGQIYPLSIFSKE